MALKLIHYIKHTLLTITTSGLSTTLLIFFSAFPMDSHGQYEGGSSGSVCQSTLLNSGINGHNYRFLFFNGNGKSDTRSIVTYLLPNGESEGVVYNGGIGQGYKVNAKFNTSIAGSNLHYLFLGGIGKGDIADLQQNVLLTGLDAGSLFSGGRGRGDENFVIHEININGNYPGALALGGIARSDFTLAKFSTSVTGEDLVGLARGGIGRSDARGLPFSVILNQDQFEPYIETLGACDMASVMLTSPQSGSTYQWQYSIDSFYTYSDVIANDYFADIATSTLLLTGIPSVYSGYQFRCVVDGAATPIIILRFTLYWQGDENTDWHHATNWNCDKIPDVYSEVTIHGAGIVNFPELNQDGICKTLTQLAGALLTVKSGHSLSVAGPQ